MIERDALIAQFNRMLEERWGYIPNTSGQEWTQTKQDAATGETVRKYGQQWVGHRVADCSGAFVWAYRQYGQSIYHGSNRIARVYVDELLPVSQARPGMAAFKVRQPGQQYYDLKAEYRPGGKYYNGDVLDFYHIGLVDTDPRYVLNAQSVSTGFVRSKISQNWECVGYLKAVEYEDKNVKMEVLYNAKVTSINGKAVNLRRQPNLNGALIKTVPVGTVVSVLAEVNADWAQIKVGNDVGYMMRSYLLRQDENEEAPDDTIAKINSLLKGAQKLLDEAIMLLSGLNK